ncbi:hypothetical protein ND16A_0375 [Thalassotalea sp. ND16A]|nr:hypothetical protein ND16A_0375 [Thalassotalea sp. ND16A]
MPGFHTSHHGSKSIAYADIIGVDAIANGYVGIWRYSKRLYVPLFSQDFDYQGIRLASLESLPIFYL